MTGTSDATQADWAVAVKVLRREAKHFDTDGSAASLTRVADALAGMGWRPISEAGTEPIIGLLEAGLVFKMHWQSYYDKWPQERYYVTNTPKRVLSTINVGMI